MNKNFNRISYFNNLIFCYNSIYIINEILQYYFDNINKFCYYSNNSNKLSLNFNFKSSNCIIQCT